MIKKATYTLLLLAMALLNGTIYAQSRASSSKITCLEIIDDNTVKITWTKSIIDSFDSYTLFFSKDGNSFDTLKSFADPDSITYTHIGVNANQSRKYYYVQVNGGQDPDISTIAGTLFIIGIDVNANGYQADIYWEPFSEPLPQNDAYYTVYNYEADLPLPIGTTPNTVYRDVTVHTCDDSVNFSVTVEMFGCSSNSQIVGARFKDIILPDKPVLDSVSVTPGGQTIIGWTQSDSLDVVGNIIYRYEGIKWIPIDTIWGYDTKFYTDPVIDPCSGNYIYAISSFDSCGNNSPFTDKTSQRPIFLYDIPYSVCDLQDTLRWTVYINPKNPIDQYQIWSSKENGSFEMIGTVDPITGKDELFYVHKDLDPGVKYEYFIRVKMGDITSSSCIKEVHTASYQIPKFINTITANVLEDNTVIATINGDMDVNKCTWDIWRFSTEQPDTILAGEVTKPSQNTSPFDVNDDNVDASTNPWFYYTTVIDSCGKLRLTSDNFKTIWLQGYTQNNINYLSWTASEGWTEGVEKYYIYRTVPGVEPTSPHDSVGANTLTYNEPAPDQGIEDGRTIYFVRSLKKSTSGERITSSSNRTPLYKEATLYFPNAFRPEGKNNDFKPVFSFFGGNSYLFQIYNRWGKLIFETSNPLEGWKGTYNNEPVEQGAYVYVVSYHSVNGENKTFKGTVLLIQ